MNAPFHTEIRCLGALLAFATVLMALAASSALGQGRPAESYYTPQDVQRMSDSWAARGGVLANVPSSSYYLPQEIEALSQGWAARGRPAARERPADHRPRRIRLGRLRAERRSVARPGLAPRRHRRRTAFRPQRHCAAADGVVARSLRHTGRGASSLPPRSDAAASPSRRGRRGERVGTPPSRARHSLHAVQDRRDGCGTGRR